jgi:hypothetical protein
MQANANAERAHVMRFIFPDSPRGDAPLFVKSKTLQLGEHLPARTHFFQTCVFTVKNALFSFNAAARHGRIPVVSGQHSGRTKTLTLSDS